METATEYIVPVLVLMLLIFILYVNYHGMRAMKYTFYGYKMMPGATRFQAKFPHSFRNQRAQIFLDADKILYKDGKDDVWIYLRELRSIDISPIKCHAFLKPFLIYDIEFIDVSNRYHQIVNVSQSGVDALRNQMQSIPHVEVIEHEATNNLVLINGILRFNIPKRRVDSSGSVTK